MVLSANPSSGHGLWKQKISLEKKGWAFPLLVLLSLSGQERSLHAQVAEQAEPQSNTEPSRELLASPPRNPLDRIALVLVGDSNPESRAFAREIVEILKATYAFPADELLGALIGEDGIPSATRDRQNLGSSESEDIPILGRLGDRSQVPLLLVLRMREGKWELLGFDVQRRSFYEGSLHVEKPIDPMAIRRFVRSRLRASLHAMPPSETLPASPAPPSDDMGLWLERNWPFILIGAAFGAFFAAFVALSPPSDSPPILRVRLGGEP
ncbi:MAG: hypothetical protein N2515_04350 [Deltaproteobacteria bacterium]|nr:hypothetical protein [Sandaracinaceae bacterium]MCX7807816.1 hypothetical protein [Deltaproteobacteria bacterium]